MIRWSLAINGVEKAQQENGTRVGRLRSTSLRITHLVEENKCGKHFRTQTGQSGRQMWFKFHEITPNSIAAAANSPIDLRFYRAKKWKSWMHGVANASVRRRTIFWLFQKSHWVPLATDKQLRRCRWTPGKARKRNVSFMSWSKPMLAMGEVKTHWILDSRNIAAISAKD